MTEIATALIVSGGKILMEKRRPDKPAYPGKWMFPGGRIEEGEKPFDALKREMKEELGIGVSAALQCCTVSDIEPLSGRAVRITAFIVKQWDGNITKSTEADKLGWFLKDEIKGLDAPPVVLVLLKCLK